MTAVSERPTTTAPPRSNGPSRPVRGSAVGAAEVVDGRRTTGRLVAAMVVVIVGLWVALWALSDSLENINVVELPRLEVPSVRNLELDAARAQLEQGGFAVSVQFQPNDVQPKGTIIGQRPLAGAKVEQGELVVILASDGPLGLMVPSVAGQQAVDATAALQGVGLVVEAVPVADEVVRAGEVVGTDPAAGGRSVPGALVRLLVSSGPAPRQVPLVVNKPVEQALAEIGRSGLGIGKIKRVFREDLVTGTVFAIDPPEGALLPRDTPVTLSVAGPQETTPAPYLVGLLESSAQQVAKSAKFTLKVIASPVIAGDPTAGRVISQGTPPQAPLPEGSTIEVTIAVETAPAAAAAVPAASAPAGPTSTPGG